MICIPGKSQAPQTDIPATGLKAYIADLAARHGVRYTKTGISALAGVITHLADDDVTPDETEQLIIALRRSKVIDGPTMLTLMARYFDDQSMVIFLDFDGVTHPEPYSQESAFKQLPLIESVVREMSGVDIVVTSSWRETHTLDELRGYFAVDMQDRVIGVTPNLWDSAQAPAFVRERECRAWLAANRQVGTRWLAIDDRPSWFQPNCPNLFVTDTLQGFQPRQMEQLRKMIINLHLSAQSSLAPQTQISG